MGYEQRFDAFERSDGDYAAAVRAFAWLNEYRSRTLTFPDREIILGTPASPGLLALQGLNRSKIKAGQGTVFMNAKLTASGCYDCETEIQLNATGEVTGAALTVDTSPGQPTAQNRWESVRIEGAFERGIHYKDSAALGNNDFNQFNSLAVYGTREENVWIDSAMSVGHAFRNANLSGGKYGVRSRGAFEFSGATNGHSVSDFIQSSVVSVPGTIIIRHVNSEGSARFFVNYEPVDDPQNTDIHGTIANTTQVFGIPVTFEGVRFALDAAVVDARDTLDGSGFACGNPLPYAPIACAVPINCGFRGPYTVKGCHFASGLFSGHVNGVERVRLRLAGGSASPDKGGSMSDNIIATDSITTPLLDRGRATNNLGYLYPSDSYVWLPDHAP